MSPRPFAEIRGSAQQVNCSHCHAPAGRPCAPDGVHVLRLSNAYTYGAISDAEFTAALRSVVVFTEATLVTGSASERRVAS